MWNLAFCLGPGLKEVFFQNPNNGNTLPTFICREYKGTVNFPLKHYKTKESHDYL